MNVYHHDPHGNLYEAPNPLTLAPILQHWVTEFCRLSTSSSSSSEQQQGLDRRHQIFSLPYTLRPGDLEFSRLDPSQNSNPESTWRIIVPSVKTFGACLDDHDQPSQSQSFRQWYFRPQGLILSSETPYNFDLIAGPGYGKELKVAGDLETILEGKRDLEGMEEFKKAGFMATTHLDGSSLTLTQRDPFLWLVSPSDQPPREIVYTGHLTRTDLDGFSFRTKLEIVFRVGHLSRERLPNPISSPMGNGNEAFVVRGRGRREGVDPFGHRR